MRIIAQSILLAPRDPVRSSIRKVTMHRQISAIASITAVVIALGLAGCTSSSSDEQRTTQNMTQQAASVPQDEIEVVQGNDGSTIKTPSYQVFLPNDLFSGGWEYSYQEGIEGYPDETNRSHLLGDQLSVYAENGDTRSLAFEVYLTSKDWQGVQGQSVAQVVGEAPKDKNLQIVIAAPFQSIEGEGPEERMTRCLGPYIDLLTIASE